jgi:hypothetical protein
MIKIIWLSLFVMFFFFSCNSQPGDKNKNNVKNILSSNDQVIFEKLSKIQKDSFINTNKQLLNKHILSYYDRYSSIKNTDTIFSLLSDCRSENEKVIPFYFYVVDQLNQNSDGYLGESIWSYSYDLFLNHSKYIYLYLSVYKNEKFDNYKDLLFSIMFYINGYQFKNNVLDSIFNSHKYKYPEYKEIIDSVHYFVLKNKNF